MNDTQPTRQEDSLTALVIDLSLIANSVELRRLRLQRMRERLEAWLREREEDDADALSVAYSMGAAATRASLTASAPGEQGEPTLSWVVPADLVALEEGARVLRLNGDTKNGDRLGAMRFALASPTDPGAERERLVRALDIAKAAMVQHVGSEYGLDGSSGWEALKEIGAVFKAHPVLGALWRAYGAIETAIADEDGLDDDDARETYNEIREAIRALSPTTPREP